VPGVQALLQRHRMAGKFQIPEPEMRTVSLLFAEDMVGFKRFL
jgi:hypothetical protein